MKKSAAKSGNAAKKGAVVSIADREVSGPRSLTRVLGLFDVLAKKPDGLTLAELNGVLESPKSSLLNLLRPLVSEGYLMHGHGLYRLGPTAFRMAANIMSVWNFSKLVRPYLEELSSRSKETVYIGVLDRAAQVITYVDAIDSAHSIRYSITVGTNRPLYCTAAGRVLLAFADDEFQEDYLRTAKLLRRTAHTLTDRKELRKQLERIRRTGTSTSMGELFEGSAAISAPVYGSDGKVLAAIAIGAPMDRFESELPKLREIISDVAARISGEQSLLVPTELEEIGRRQVRTCFALGGAIQCAKGASRALCLSLNIPGVISMARYTFLVFSNPVAGQEEEYNRWYTQQHLGDVLRVPGFVAAQRFKLPQDDPAAPAPYLAVYEIESGDVQKTLAQLNERAGTSQMLLSPALDVDRVKTFLYEAVCERQSK